MEWMRERGVNERGENEWMNVTSGERSIFGSLFRRRAAALTSFFLAAMCKAGKRILPRESFSKRMATTFSWPCCKATANGVKPSSVAKLWLALFANKNLTTSMWFSCAALFFLLFFNINFILFLVLKTIWVNLRHNHVEV